MKCESMRNVGEFVSGRESTAVYNLYNVLDTSKIISIVLPFPCMEMFSWFKCIKNQLRIAIWQSSCCL